MRTVYCNSFSVFLSCFIWILLLLWLQRIEYHRINNGEKPSTIYKSDYFTGFGLKPEDIWGHRIGLKEFTAKNHKLWSINFGWMIQYHWYSWTNKDYSMSYTLISPWKILKKCIMNWQVINAVDGRTFESRLSDSLHRILNLMTDVVQRWTVGA